MGDTREPMATSDDKADTGTIIHLVKWGSTKQYAGNRCPCRKTGLSCTDLCSCYNEMDEPCQNIVTAVIDDDEDNE